MENEILNTIEKATVKGSAYYKIVVLFLLFLVSMDVFPQLGFHISNYQGDVVLARYYDNKTIMVDTLKGYGLYVYGNGHLDKGIYFFQAGNKTVEFPLGEDQNFRVIADYNSKDIQNTAQISGSRDNSFFQQFFNLRSPDEKMRFWETNQKLIDDPFIRACIRASIPVVPPSGLSRAERQNYTLYHYFDHIDFTVPGLINTPFVNDRINSFFTELIPLDEEKVRYLTSLMDRAVDKEVRDMVSCFLLQEGAFMECNVNNR